MYRTFGINWKQAGQWDGGAKRDRTQQGDMSKKQGWLPGTLPPGRVGGIHPPYT